jgi:hypothetical protein
LRSWFREYPEERNLHSSILLAHLINNAAAFNKKLAQTLHDAGVDRALASTLESLVAEIIATSTFNAEGRRVPSTTGRLRLVGLHALDCMLQRREGQGRWIDVSDEPLNDEAVRNGYEDGTSGTRWRGDDRLLFVEGASSEGFVGYHGAVNLGVNVIVLYDKDVKDVASIGRRLHDATAREVLLGPSLQCFRAYRFTVTENDDDLLKLFSCEPFSARFIRLEGGLSDGRVWLSASPPKIIVASSITHVYVNGKSHAVDDNREVTFCTPLPSGRYVVTVEDEQVTFDVEDGEALPDSTDGEEIVYELNSALKTCRINRCLSDSYLVGAYIGIGKVPS